MKANRGGLRYRLLEFFRNNPGEELTHDDLVVKFGVNKRTAEGAIAQMKSLGELESVHIIRPLRR